MADSVAVAVAVIRRDLGSSSEILIAKRAKDLHQGGLWEFPGGKIEAGESVRQALARELQEELGIQIDVDDAAACRPLISIAHDYGDKKVLLDTWEVTRFAGEPDGREGQPLQWVSTESLDDFAFPAANYPIINACKLPRYYVITPPYKDINEARASLAAMLARGLTFIQLRQPDLSPAQYRVWAESLLEIFHQSPLRIMLNGDPDVLSDLPAAGIQVPIRFAEALTERPVALNGFFSVSCHNRREVLAAQAIGADFCTLSPVNPTTTHPGVLPLGWEELANVVAEARIPVFALGGVTRQDDARAFNAGAQGVAGIRTWQSTTA